jgi:prepilin-type N-terminal cleavage/methylation domain-containing protein
VGAGYFEVAVDIKKQGYTLIELIVVLGLIATLAMLAVVGLSGFMERGRAAQTTADAVAMAAALNTYNLYKQPNERILSASDVTALFNTNETLDDFLDLLPVFSFGGYHDGYTPGQFLDLINQQVLPYLQSPAQVENTLWVLNENP